MTYERDFDELMREWADLGDDRLPDRYLEAALREIDSTQQRGARPAPLEGSIMRMKHAAPVIVTVAVAIIGLAVYLAISSNVGNPERSPTPSATVAPSAGPTIVARPLPATAASVDLAGTPNALRSGADAIYASVGDQIVRIDPTTLQAAPVVDVPDTDTSCADCGIGRGSWAFDVDDTSAWVAYHRDDQSLVRRFSLSDGALVAEILIGSPEGGGNGADDIVVAFGSVWTSQCHSGTVARIDPATNEVALIELGELPGSCPYPATIGADGDSIWAGLSLPMFGNSVPRVFEIDPATESVTATIEPSNAVRACGHFAFAAASTWLASCAESHARSLVRIDADRAAADGPIALDGFPGDPFVAAGQLWVPMVSSPDLGGRLLALDDGGAAIDAIDLGAVAGGTHSAAATVFGFDAAWIAIGDGQVVRIPVADLST